MHNIYINKQGNLFDGYTCNVSGMVKCELNDDGQPYSHYNLDGTPNKSKTIKAKKEAVELKKYAKFKADKEAKLFKEFKDEQS